MDESRNKELDSMMAKSEITASIGRVTTPTERVVRFLKEKREVYAHENEAMSRADFSRFLKELIETIEDTNASQT